ncbi:MAG: tetratricopeptide repeat protein [Gemmataceae bacterium]|nr:tetratricopeptide repeat protein [Gemmataceae bacterium]
MDGRRLRRWWLCGGLAAGALGCHRDSYHDQFVMPKPGQPVGAIAPANGNMAMTPAIGQGPVAGVPVEMATPKRPAGKGLSPDGEVAFADTHVAAAFADPAPPNRDQLLDMARMRYQKALKEDPKNKAALLGVARMSARLGDRDKAVEGYKKYLSAYPKDHEVPHELALKHGQWGDWAGAVGWCEAALKLDPENRTYRKTMGFCLARAGRWDDAYTTLRQVMPEAQARYNLARVMEHLNFPEQSRQWAAMAVQADPNFADAREFLAELDQGYRLGGPTPAGGNPVMQAGYQQPQP